jgi:hypothetical protein
MNHKNLFASVILVALSLACPDLSVKSSYGLESKAANQYPNQREIGSGMNLYDSNLTGANFSKGEKNPSSGMLKNIEFLQSDGRRTYELKKGGLTFQTDFVLVIDTTDSMGASIDSVKSQAALLIDTVFDNGKKDARIGVVGFKDTKNGEPSEVILPFTDDDEFEARKVSAITAINNITVSGGSDSPRTAFNGLRTALNGSIGAWRGAAGVLRIALFTNAAASDGELAGEVTKLAKSIGASISSSPSASLSSGSNITFKLISQAVPTRIIGFSTESGDPFGSPLPPFVPSNEPITPDLTTAEVQIFTIFTGTVGTDTTSLSDIAITNGGAFFTAPTNDELVRQLLEIARPTN